MATKKTSVLVTGGTGFLGAHLVDILSQSNKYTVRVLSRHSSTKKIKNVSFVEGDIVSNADSLQKALDGCEGVFHLAGLVSRDLTDSRDMMKLHVEGTINLFKQAHQAGVKRIVVVSTSGTIAVSKETKLANEESDCPMAIIGQWPYYLSKLYQEKEALRLGREFGIDVVIINPSLLLGPGDHRLSSIGDVHSFMNKEFAIVPSGGVSFVDVRDAAQATYTAFEKGIDQERYLITAVNWTFKEFFGRLERASKVMSPQITVPDVVALWGSKIMKKASAYLGREAIDPISVEMSQYYWYADASKATQVLEFKPREAIETLNDTVSFLRNNF